MNKLKYYYSAIKWLWRHRAEPNNRAEMAAHDAGSWKGGKPMLIVDMPIGSDLVDRAVLYERLKQWQDAAYDTVTLAFLHEVKMLIGSAPHIKAVELVRCKDCLHHEEAQPYDEEDELIPSNAVFCQHFEVIRDKNWFCADGERKDGE